MYGGAIFVLATDLTVFNAVHLRFRLDGVTQAQAMELVERFKRR